MSAYLHLQTIPDLFTFFEPHSTPQHPLIAVVDFSKVDKRIDEETRILTDLYCILFKDYCNNSIRYGRKVIDFKDGSLVCMAPGQVIELDAESFEEMRGWGIFFHPDLIRATTLNHKMKEYTFFSYETAEALHLSDKEKQVLQDCIVKIETELQENIDIHSQSIIVSNIELFLNYCTRFYGRQFITRKSTHGSVVGQIEQFLSDYFGRPDTSDKNLLTVKYLADQVNLSPGYLSDLLRKETGKNAQEHIHFYMIEEAKNILLSTNKSIGEIAYALGFEYPQYFNKLFKQKTGKTPVEFRNMN
ncbi:AraC-type DNA-binding protein [Filimonas lacunae]|uniref:AraC-type DNA-binding protein n=1 Tax=Filimonas lacunae TaxID=477680 RepID=A0A173MH77_9BACT|nr:AraC family transcriptional regulator [Filimonas lacunae]BAV06963.1 transcriptional regulator, AraC family [Filimonas lacunae]SIS97163.1 AraC-type DNA-binding protein [Filimonas lacunae]